MTSLSVPLLITILFFAGLFTACTSPDASSASGAADPSSKTASKKEEKPAEKNKREKRTQVVEVATLQTQSLPSVVSFPVFLEGRKQVSVYPRVGGRIQAIRKKTGEKIRREQTIFSVDRNDPGTNFLALPVTSPITGYVARWFKVEGDQVSAGDPVVLVVDDSSLRAKIWLPVSDWQQVDMKTKVSLESNGQVKEARIISVARAIEVSAGKGLVEVEVDNESGAWKSGFSAIAHIELSPQPRLIMPSQALLLTNDGAFTYVVEKGMVKRHKVDFRPRTPDLVELAPGSLPDGTKVVISGTSRLADGLKVTIAGEEQGS